MDLLMQRAHMHAHAQPNSERAAVWIRACQTIPGERDSAAGKHDLPHRLEEKPTRVSETPVGHTEVILPGSRLTEIGRTSSSATRYEFSCWSFAAVVDVCCRCGVL